MAWQSLSGMSGGSGGGNVQGDGGQGQQQSNQPQGTEYTLQGLWPQFPLESQYKTREDMKADFLLDLGVMRFLQTEWHRHERDRNAWEIERQEMKGRIARLEGSTRKADSTNKALKKYVNMLESALRDRDSQVKKLKAGADIEIESIRDHKEKKSKEFEKHLQRRKFTPPFMEKATDNCSSSAGEPT